MSIVVNNRTCIVTTLILIFVTIIYLRYFCSNDYTIEEFRRRRRQNRYRREINKLKQKLNELKRSYEALRVGCTESKEDLFGQLTHQNNKYENLLHENNELKFNLKKAEEMYSNTLNKISTNTNTNTSTSTSTSTSTNNNNYNNSDTNDYDTRYSD